MFYVDYKRKGVKIRKIWFASKREKLLEKQCDVVVYQQADFHVDRWCTQFCTLVSDLQIDEGELFNKIHKRPRQAISRAYREQMKFEIMNSDNLEDFIKQYNIFAKSKALNAYNTPLMNAYNKQNILTVAKVSFNNEQLVYIAYIDDGNRVRALIMANNYRLESSSNDKNIFGRASRFLQWSSIVYFKKLGYKKYDWGGYSTLGATKNIAEYKATFGGEVEYSNNILVPCSIIGRIILYVIDIKNFIKRCYKTIIKIIKP